MTGEWKRLRALAVFVLALGSPALLHGQAEPVEGMEITPSDDPVVAVGKLYLDLSGILRPPHDPTPPDTLWSQTLSSRTQSLYRQLRRLEEEKRFRAFDHDWLCQCEDTKSFRLPVPMVVERRAETHVELSAGLRFTGGEVRRARLFMVYEDGWKIDDIVNENGRRFTTEIERAIRQHS